MAKYILSAFTDEYSDNFDEQIAVARSLGLKYIELRHADGKNVSELDEQTARVMEQKLSSAGISVSAIASPIGKIAIDGDLEAHLTLARRVFRTANIFGARRVRIFSFYPGRDKKIADCEEQVFAALGRLADIAKEYGVTLCHENEADIYGQSPQSCKKILDRFGSIKCVFDMGNFVLDGYKPYPDAYESLRDKIEYFHIKDSLFAGAIVPAGKGEANIEAILADYLHYADGEIIVSLEPHLETFSGFNALTSKKFDNPFKYADQKEAFLDAHRSLVKILPQGEKL